MSEPLLILGASTRAAGSSALRAGFEPTCVDLFADRDLAAVCRTERVGFQPSWDKTLDRFAEVAERQEPQGWIYTGPFENHPALVDRISHRHRLLGNPGHALARVRDPFELADCLLRAELSSLEIASSADGLPCDGSWLAKPLASGGGLGITVLNAQFGSPEPGLYFQRRIPGRSHSALFLADSRRAGLVGITRLYRGSPGNPFSYRGNLGPMEVSTGLEQQLRRTGEALAHRFGLAGLFGVDFIIHKGRVWVVELNPRYTAAVEIYELAGGPPLLRAHHRLCDIESSDPSPPLFSMCESRWTKAVGKWILYAIRPFVFRDIPVPDFARMPLEETPEIADVPAVGQSFDRGDPVLTVFAEGATPAECAARLRSRVRSWRGRLDSVS